MKTNGHSETDKKVSAIGNERGAALIIVLIMLVLLTILGASMLATSTSELRIAGNYRNSEEAFYVADSAMEFAHTYATIYTSLSLAAGETFWPKAGQGKKLGSDFSGTAPYSENSNYNQITIISENGVESTADVKVEFMGDGPPPAGYGFGEDSTAGYGTPTYKANFYAVSVISNGPNNTVAMQNSQLARIVPQ